MYTLFLPWALPVIVNHTYKCKFDIKFWVHGTCHYDTWLEASCTPRTLKNFIEIKILFCFALHVYNVDLINDTSFGHAM